MNVVFKDGIRIYKCRYLPVKRPCCAFKPFLLQSFSGAALWEAIEAIWAMNIRLLKMDWIRFKDCKPLGYSIQIRIQDPSSYIMKLQWSQILSPCVHDEYGSQREINNHKTLAKLTLNRIPSRTYTGRGSKFSSSLLDTTLHVFFFSSPPTSSLKRFFHVSLYRLVTCSELFNAL